MAYTSGRYHLTNLLQDAYRKLGQFEPRLVTGSPTATSCIIGALAGLKSIKEGTLFCIETTDNEAPEGKYERITDYTKATGTFTVDTFTASFTAGDMVAVVNDLYPIRTMVELANGAMKRLGDIRKVDTTTLDTESNKTEYALEIAAKRGLYQVDYQTNTADADDNRWYTIFDVDTIPSDPGSAALMILPQLASGRDIRYWYADAHPRLNTYDDFIDEAIIPDLASTALVVVALEWQQARIKADWVKQDLNYWRTEFDIAMQKWDIKRSQRKAKFITMPRATESTYTGEVGKVRL